MPQNLPSSHPKKYKQPVSVLVIIYDDQQRILLLQRTDHPEFWQSVTGSREEHEAMTQTALREVFEETGIQASPAQLQDWHHVNQYEIYPHWRYRYAPGVTHNTEHVFSLCIPADSNIKLSAREHLQAQWYDLPTAITKVFSPSNRAALIQLPQYWSVDPLSHPNKP